jgi:Ankyrin repeat
MDANSRNSAIQRLEQMGIPYSEETFLEYVARGDASVVALFLEAGIRPSAKTPDGDSALTIAAVAGHAQIAQKLIAAGADPADLVVAVHNKASKKDVWDKLSALSAVATILVAAIGGWFTYTYNSHQSAAEGNIKAEQNRVSQMDIVSKMLPQLQDDRSRCGALLIIRSVSPDPTLAVQLATYYQGSGSVCALEKLATTDNQQTSQYAVEALSSIAKSPSETNRQAFSALSVVASSSTQNRSSALAALNNVSQNNSEAAICADVSDFRECHQRYPTGCGITGRYDAYLNLLKNELLSPDLPVTSYMTAQEFSALDLRIPQDVNRQNHATLASNLTQLGEGKIVGVVGYVYKVTAAGKDSSNCELTGLENVSYHLRIGFSVKSVSEVASTDQRSLEQSSIVAQTSPHSRALYHPDWTLESLRSLAGQQIKVSGQLLFNNSHSTAREDCGVNGANRTTCWRLSAWEVTPITDIWVCRSGSCSAEAGNWVNFSGSTQRETP